MTTQYEFCCPTCDNDLVFEGTDAEADADCPECGTVSICPAEIFESIAGELAGDAQRDER